MKMLTVVMLCWSGVGIAAGSCPALLNYKVSGLMGGEINLCQYADKPILVVNTASRCGFTPQFNQLESLHEQYGARGLIVIGFPSNDFAQELESSAAIGEFCKANYGVSFPMSGKVHVRGSDVSPFFKALADTTGDAPSWNFHKYLILPNGKGVKSFGTRVKPDAPEVVNSFLPYLKP